jgi:hypothetical protein
MIEIEQVNIWTNQIESLQSKLEFDKAAKLVKEILAQINSYQVRLENDTEWISVILKEETMIILNSEI